MQSSLSKPVSASSELLELCIGVVSAVSAGFPSPADDFLDVAIDLNKELIKRPSSTFFSRVRGNSMKNAGITDGDLLVIDKSITPRDEHIVICFLDGEFTLKRLLIRENNCVLMPENSDYEPIIVSPENNFQIWGVVVHCIKSTFHVRTC
jgi:DNA polymerase V